MGQLGERYIVVSEPDNVDRWGVAVSVEPIEEPLIKDSEACKLYNLVKTSGGSPINM